MEKSSKMKHSDEREDKALIRKMVKPGDLKGAKDPKEPHKFPPKSKGK